MIRPRVRLRTMCVGIVIIAIMLTAWRTVQARQTRLRKLSSEHQKMARHLDRIAWTPCYGPSPNGFSSVEVRAIRKRADRHHRLADEYSKAASCLWPLEPNPGGLAIQIP
jgi:hypothetical protein